MNIKTLAEMVNSLDKLYGERPFIKYRKEGEWISIGAEESKDIIYSLSAGLLSLGLNKGDKLTLISDTRYEWTLIDFAMEVIGLVNVPVYPSLTGEQMSYLIKHSEAKVIVVAKKSLLDKLTPYIDDLQNIKKIIIFDGETDVKKNVLSLNDLETKGKSDIESKGKKYLEDISQSIKEEDLASILYTSGTTGVPKGVMLTHKNFVTNAIESYERLELQPFVKSLVFLPLSHAYARTCNYNMMTGGITLMYAENVGTIGRDLQETGPEFLVGVPRVYEKMYEKIVYNAEKSGGLKKSIFNWAKKLAVKYTEKIRDKKPIGPFFKIKYSIANALVYKKIKEKTGGELVFIQSGASALPKYISYFFTGIGIHVLEGYGLTEASPIICSNNIRQNKLGTVGLPLESTEVKLGEDKELLIKGPNVMKGYYKNDSATKEVLTEDNWLKTGDICDIDDEGYIRVIERKKDLIKTSAGKYIVPQYIENKAKINKYISEFVIIAENRKYVSALILPNFDNLKEYCKEQKIEYKTDRELIEKTEINNLYRKIINEEINKDLANYESIFKFVLISEPFTIDKGELTPTLKVKRNVVYKKYREEIEKLYS